MSAVLAAGLLLSVVPAVALAPAGATTSSQELSVEAAAVGFIDVPESHRFAAAIGWLVPRGITTGCSADRFAPSGTVTCGQMAAFLWRMADQPDREQPGTNRLPDEVVVADPDPIVSPQLDPDTGATSFR